MNEVHPQTDRERQLELQMAFLMQQLHSEEKAKQKLSELKQQRRKEQDTIDEYRKACERVVDREILMDKDVSAGLEIEKTRLEEAWTRVRMLKADSEAEINKYRDVRDRPIARMIFKLARLDDTLIEAKNREKKLRNELEMSEERSEKWKRELRKSLDRKSPCSCEVQQSIARRNLFKRLIDERDTKVEQARKVRKDIGTSCNSIMKLNEELAQAYTRQSWLTSGEELCRQTSAEGNVLSQGLQNVLEKEKRFKETLEMMAERLKNKLKKIDRAWIGSTEQSDQTCRIFENEEKLQKRLNEVSVREERIQVETERVLSQEHEMQQELRQACAEAGSFISQLTEQKDKQYGKCSLSYICKTRSSVVVIADRTSG